MRNWFIVDRANMRVVVDLFKRDGFTLPFPKCFGKPVKSFDLNLKPSKTVTKTKTIQWKAALNKVMSLLL